MLPQTVDAEFLTHLCKTPVDDAIAPHDLNTALSGPPFVALPGSLNFRDVGASAPAFVRPGLVFRSGMLDLIPSDSLDLLHSNFGIVRIYDFRRLDELKRPPRQIDGIQVFSCPYNKDGEQYPPPDSLELFAHAEDGSAGSGYLDMYETILQGYTTGYRKAFEGLRRLGQGEAILFHCTAGKDRTGVMAALVLDLMGAPVQVIANDYALTRIGTEPFRENLLPVVLKSLGIDLTADLTLDDKAKPGLREFLTTSADTMVRFMEHLHSVHGGAEGYLSRSLGLSHEEIKDIRSVLRPREKV